jgi:multiple sugar transport system substrate-binding protein
MKNKKSSTKNTTNMKRREFLTRIGWMTTGTLALSLFPRCGGGNGAKKEVPLTFEAQYPKTDWTSGVVDPNISGTFRIMSWEGEFQFKKWNLIINKFFETYYPKMKVQLDWGINFGNYNIKLPVLLAGGEPPDLVWMHDTRAKSFASLDLLQPLDPFIEHFKPLGWPEDYYPSQIESFKYQGKQYCFPYDFGTGGFYVNLEMYNEIDEELPNENWTFDDILRVAKKLTKGKSQYGINLVPETNAGYQYWIIKAFGGDWFNEDLTESRFNMPETIEAFQWTTDLRWKHKVSPLPDPLTQKRPPDFIQGIVAIDFQLGAPAFADFLEGKFDWTVAPTPRGPAGRFQFVGGSALAIPRKVKYRHIAYELIRYMLSNPENLKIIGKMGRMFVSRMSMYEYGLPTGQLAQKLSNYKHVFYDLARRDGVIVPYFPKYQQWDDIYRRNTQLLYFGDELNARKACLKLHDETNRFFESIHS